VKVARVEVGIVVGRPVAVVFDYMTDPASVSEWQSTVVEARLEEDPPLRAGSRVRETRKFLGMRFHATMQVVEHDPPSRFALEAVSTPIPFRVTSSLAEVPAGTRVDAVLEGDPGRLFRLGESFVVRAAERELRKNLGALKRILESRTP
jgi:uncharacterized protein YndB with AHSA1/START domain